MKKRRSFKEDKWIWIAMLGVAIGVTVAQVAVEAQPYENQYESHQPTPRTMSANSDGYRVVDAICNDTRANVRIQAQRLRALMQHLYSNGYLTTQRLTTAECTRKGWELMEQNGDL